GAESWGLFRGIGSPTGGWDLPRDVLDVPEARLMVLSVYHRCVVPPGSDVVRCWGICNVECGVAQYTSETVFTDTPAENVIGLATASLIQGRGATCILSADGALRCMGFNPFVLDSVSHAEPVPITIHGEAPYFRDVQGGYEHLCGSVGQGAGSQRKAVCWGRNTWNQLGSHDAPLPGSEPTGAPPIFYVQEEGGGDLSTVVKTAVGRTRSCALLDNGSVFCWGDNGGGELGSGDTLPHVGAVMVKGVHKAVDIAVGGSHACAVETLGHEVKCWGHGASAGQGNRQGDVADGIYFSTAQPVPGLDATVTGAAVVEIRAGNAHTCVRLDTGAVLCWGPNGSGELGDGTAIERLAPTLVPTLL
ncbi:MAG TPA: hypothetical protein VJU61_13735, partial [Polyangiaceae bacterium]|nr:hypothetical protein [Polyangiaceae bacterium]